VGLGVLTRLFIDPTIVFPDPSVDTVRCVATQLTNTLPAIPRNYAKKSSESRHKFKPAQNLLERHFLLREVSLGRFRAGLNLCRSHLGIVSRGGVLYHGYTSTVQISLNRAKNSDQVCSPDLCGNPVRACQTEPAGGRAGGSARPVLSCAHYILRWQCHHPPVYNSTGVLGSSSTQTSHRRGRCIHAGLPSPSSPALAGVNGVIPLAAAGERLSPSLPPYSKVPAHQSSLPCVMHA